MSKMEVIYEEEEDECYRKNIAELDSFPGVNFEFGLGHKKEWTSIRDYLGKCNPRSKSVKKPQESDFSFYFKTNRTSSTSLDDRDLITRCKPIFERRAHLTRHQVTQSDFSFYTRRMSTRPKLSQMTSVPCEEGSGESTTQSEHNKEEDSVHPVKEKIQDEYSNGQDSTTYNFDEHHSVTSEDQHKRDEIEEPLPFIFEIEKIEDEFAEKNGDDDFGAIQQEIAELYTRKMIATKNLITDLKYDIENIFDNFLSSILCQDDLKNLLLSALKIITCEQLLPTGDRKGHYCDLYLPLNVLKSHMVNLCNRELIDKSCEVIGNMEKGTCMELNLVRNSKNSVFVTKEVQIDSYYMLKRSLFESVILQSIDHPMILKIYESFMYKTLHSIVIMHSTEFIYGADLYHLRTCISTRGMKLYIAACVVSVLEFLHDNYIVHGDIKLENIMVDHNGKIKLIDFGHAEYNNGWLLGMRGTNGYQAPEMFNKSKYCSYGVDFFALGCVMYIFEKGIYPYTIKDSNDSVSLKGEVDLKQIEPVTCSLIEGLLQKEDTKRIGYSGIREIKQHGYFARVNFEGLESVDSPLRSLFPEL